MTTPRQILPGSFYFLTRRTTQRMFMLRPDAKTKQIFEFCLALAMQKYGVVPLAWVVMSNHYHLVVYDEAGSVPAFTQYFNRLLASVFNDRWGRRENFWSSDPPCITFVATEEDVLEKIAYTLNNPVKGKLVDSIGAWPCSSLDFLDGKTRIVTRPEEYFSPDSDVIPETIALRLSSPKGRSFAAWAKRVRARVAELDASAALRRKEDRKFRSCGIKKVLAKRPTDRPTKKAPPCKLRPRVACGNRDERIRYLVRYKEFCWQYRDARKRFAERDPDVVFPKGTYRLRQLARVRIGKCARYDQDRLKKHVSRIPSDSVFEDAV